MTQSNPVLPSQRFTSITTPLPDPTATATNGNSVTEMET